MTCSRLITTLTGFTVAVCSSVLLSGGVAGADPAPPALDPHLPDAAAGYCPGGGAGIDLVTSYCSGTKYPDGSYWRDVRTMLPFTAEQAKQLGLRCVVDVGTQVRDAGNGQPTTHIGVVAAPPDGCGAVGAARDATPAGE